MSNYNTLEKIVPRWRERWKCKLIKLGASRAVIIPHPVITCFSKRAGASVYIGWAVDEKTNKDLLLLDIGD